MNPQSKQIPLEKQIPAELLKQWRNETGNDKISCYEDLKGMPVILILVDKGKMGDTFPDSLRYVERSRVTSSDVVTSKFVR